jgi:hypothetical protein
MSSAFYNNDPVPSGRGWLIYPIRRLIRRLQRPYYLKLESVLDDLGAKLNNACQELHHVRQELNQARQELQQERQQTGEQVRALTCDHWAVVRRLAAIEDEVVTAFLHAQDAPMLPRLLAESDCRSQE